MEFFKSTININFYRLRTVAAVFSIVLFLVAILSFYKNGLNLGLDFTGGTQIQFSYPQAVDLNQIRSNLAKANLEEAQVQSFGDSKTILITLGVNALKVLPNETEKDMQNRVKDQLVTALPGAQFNSAAFIGAKVSSELAYKGILAVVVAMIATMIYIAFRFEWRLAVSAAISLVHDPVLILGVFSFFHIEFDLVSLAAVLTIIGYSLHDSIVVFDRVRENFRKMRKGTPVEVVNSAINQTLSRTIISSGLTLSVCVVLFLWGGSSIHAFSLALIIGIIVGTYSSIYVAGSLALALGLSRKDLLPAAKQSVDDRP